MIHNAIESLIHDLEIKRDSALRAVEYYARRGDIGLARIEIQNHESYKNAIQRHYMNLADDANYILSCETIEFGLVEFLD